MEFNKQNVKTIMKIIAATVLLCFGLANIPVITGVCGKIIALLSPFIIGICVGFVLNVPMMVWEEKALAKVRLKKNGKRMLSILLTLISVMLVIFIVMWIIVPQIINAGESVGEQIPVAMERAETFVGEYMDGDTSISNMIEQFGIDWEKYIDELSDYLKSSSGQILSTTFSVVSGTFGVLINAFMGLIFAIYILAQKEKILDQGRQVLVAFCPEKTVKCILRVFHLTEETFRHFITGQCLEAVILGTIFFVVMSIFRMPYALPISVLIMLTALIPVFGAFIGCVVGALLILVVNPLQALIFIIIFLVIQQIEGNLIYPHVVGNSVGLPSIWVFVAVILGGKLFGVVGMLVFIPICSVAYVLFREEVKKRLQKKRAAQKKPPKV